MSAAYNALADIAKVHRWGFRRFAIGYGWDMDGSRRLMGFILIGSAEGAQQL